MLNNDGQRKTVLIIGGSTGFGSRIVHEFAQSGYNVAFTYLSNEKKAFDLMKEIEKIGTNVLCLKVNVEDENQIKHMRDQVVDHYQRVDVLVNCAGIFENALTKNLDINSWNKILKVNLTGSFLSIKAIIETMETQKFGRIINIGSVVGETGAIGAVNYAASKAGLIGLTKTVAREVAKHGITVNLVSLGYMDDGMGIRLPDKIVSKILDKIPMRTFGNSEKVAKMIVHLVSDEAEYITGQVIRIDGGFLM